MQHVRPKYVCKSCQENVKIASMPILLLPKSHERTDIFHKDISVSIRQIETDAPQHLIFVGEDVFVLQKMMNPKQ